MFQLLTMPGIPVIQYGSEIAMNGTAAPETHPILDMGVDKELIDHITNLTSLRNESKALRTGDMEVLHEEEGWLVYKRSNEEDTWIIAINNSPSTKSLTLPASVIGDDKELRGLFENNIVRQNDDGSYQLTLDRELGEAFNVIEQKGFNQAYIAA
jgi:glycosidase